MSTLERFFEPQDIVRDLAAVQRALKGEQGEQRSYGRVTKHGLFYRWSGSGRRPERGGLFCQTIFGPITSYRCACGALDGPARAGEICDRCGVLSADSQVRSLRYGHLEVDGVVHPELAPLIGAALGVTAEDVLAVARCEARWLDERVERSDELDHEDLERSGPAVLVQALKQRGAAKLARVVVTRRIPVPPPGRRPFAPARDAACIDPWIGPLNEAWRSLVLTSNQQHRLLELDAPALLVMNQQGSVQRTFERVLSWTRQPPVLERAWPLRPTAQKPTPLMGLPDAVPDDVEDVVHGLLFVDDARLFVQRAARSWLVDVQSGEVLAALPTSGRLATSVHGERLRMDRWMGDEWDWYGERYWEEKSGRSSLAVLDLQTGQYLAHYPEDLPRHLIEHDEPEDLIAGSVDDAPSDMREAGAVLRWGGDRPFVLASTRDGRYVWVGEDEDTAVLATDTGLPVSDPVMVARIDEADAVVRLSEEDIRDECDGSISACALGTNAEQRLRLLHDSGHVSDGERAWYRIDAVPSAAAFSPQAERLAIAVEQEIIVLSVEAPETGARILRRFPAPTISTRTPRLAP